MLTVLALALAAPPPTDPRFVVGGAPVEPGVWPDAVALFVDDAFQCSGTLITADRILTAGHCDVGLTRAIVGASDWAVDGEEIDVVETIVYPEPLDTYDVAVVTLARPASVAPRTLVGGCALDAVYDGAAVTIAGFGAVDVWASHYDSALLAADAVITDADCSDVEAGCHGDLALGAEVRAGGDGVDSCNGDSGGPLYLRRPDGDVLLGVTSRASEPITRPCGDGGIYVRADAIRPWLEQILGVELPLPTCTTPVNHPPSPTVEPVRARAGVPIRVRLDPGDPDVRDAHAVEVARMPLYGDVTVADGEIVYLPFGDARGGDAFALRVTDDGSPALSAVVDVPVSVGAPYESPAACDAGPGRPGGAALVALALVHWRRRRR
jgi:hypothetical protein